MYKFIVLATILAFACALPTPKPDADPQQLHAVGYGHVGHHQAYVAGQPQAYIAGHNQVYLGAQHGHHGGHQRSYAVNSGYVSPYYVSSYVPLVPSHSSPVVYAY